MRNCGHDAVLMCCLNESDSVNTFVVNSSIVDPVKRRLIQIKSSDVFIQYAPLLSQTEILAGSSGRQKVSQQLDLVDILVNISTNLQVLYLVEILSTDLLAQSEWCVNKQHEMEIACCNVQTLISWRRIAEHVPMVRPKLTCGRGGGWRCFPYACAR